MSFLQYLKEMLLLDSFISDNIKKKFITQGNDEAQVNSYFDRYEELSKSSRLKNFNIQQMKTFDQMKTIIDAVPEESKREEIKNIKTSEVQKVFENDKVTVISPLTKEASIQYGKGTKWCVSGKEDCQFDRYYKDMNQKLYFIIPKTGDNNDKIIVGVNKDGSLGDINNAKNELISHYKNILSSYGISMDIFKPISKQELLRIDLLKQEELKPINEYINNNWSLVNYNGTELINGSTIPIVEDDDEWSELTTPAMCYYDNDKSKGVLYNWYAVKELKVPDGWRVPTDDDWKKIDNIKVKETDLNLTCGGYRSLSGSFYSTEFYASNAWGSSLYSCTDYIYIYNYTKSCGFSVRLVRDL